VTEPSLSLHYINFSCDFLFLFTIASSNKQYTICDKSFGPVVVGLTGNAGFNGIFYVREEARVCDLLGAAGIRNPEAFDQKMLSERLSTGKSVVTESYGRLRIVEMNNGIGWPSRRLHARLFNSEKSRKDIRVLRF